MAGQDDGRAVALRVPLIAVRQAGRAGPGFRLPPARTMLLGGILLMSGGMMAVTLWVGLSVSRDVRALVERFDRDASARAFEQAAYRAAEAPRVYVLPALRKHAAATGRPATRHL